MRADASSHASWYGMSQFACGAWLMKGTSRSFSVGIETAVGSDVVAATDGTVSSFDVATTGGVYVSAMGNGGVVRRSKTSLIATRFAHANPSATTTAAPATHATLRFVLDRDIRHDVAHLNRVNDVETLDDSSKNSIRW